MARYDDGFLQAALIGYQSEKAKIQAAITEIQAQLGHRGPGRPKAAADGEAHTAPGDTAPKRRTMSVSARRRIAAAQRKRWAAVKKAKAAPPKAKRKLSAAGRRAIIAATKKRWAAVRATKATAAGKAKARKPARKAKKAAAPEATPATA
jgi:hypothetical protein